MKKKSFIAITSIGLNLALLSVLFHFNQINDRPAESPAPFFRLQHLSAIGYPQSDNQGTVLVSALK